MRSLAHVRELPPGWRGLDALVNSQVPDLSAPPVPGAGAARLCAVCHGPAGRRRRCAQCELHEQCAPGSLADVVVAVAYAPKGSAHAGHLWQYKSAEPARASAASAVAAGASLRALLLVFLREHGSCVWQAAGMLAGPTHLAVVPTGRSRPGTCHPLRALVAPYLRRPWAELAARPAGNPSLRELDPARFAARPIPGARVLLLDDTWTTGASAQSAAMALRLAGARSVATVVLGRHIRDANGEAAGFGPDQLPYLPGRCAVHGARRAAAGP
jgi:hypothetical protein